MVKINVNELKAHPFNRIFGDLPEEEFEALKNDIASRGMQSSIDVTESNVIVCGHQRVKACKQLGIKEVDARVLKGWTEEQIKEHLIKDNVLRRQLIPFQVVEAGKELEKIYEGRHGIRHDSRDGKVSISENKVGTTRDLVSKDFGISGRTYDNYKALYNHAKNTGRQDLIQQEKKHEISLKQIKEQLEPLQEPEEEIEEEESTKAQNKLLSSIQETITNLIQTQKYLKELTEQDLEIIESTLKRLQENYFEFYEEIKQIKGGKK